MLEVRKSNAVPPKRYSIEYETPDLMKYLNKRFYLFRLRDGWKQEEFWDEQEDLEASWDGEWHPDTLFDPTWNLVALQLLETVRYENPRLQGRPYRMSMGLMVVPVDEEAHIYRRVGSFKLRWYAGRCKHNYPPLWTIATSCKLADSWKKHKGERWLGERQTIWLT